MRRVFLCMAAGWFLAGIPALSAEHSKSRDADASLSGHIFEVGDLAFTIPARWVPVAASNPARVGQWQIPPLRGQAGEGGEAVVFYFGPGVGGTARENIDAWNATMLDADGHPAAAEIKNHEISGFKISDVVIFGAHREVVPIAGIPPLLKPACGLMGAVIENPQGNIYWRFIGPESWLAANLPLFNKIIDSLKPSGK